MLHIHCIRTMSKLGHTELTNKDGQPLLSGKLATVTSVSSDHGCQEFIEAMVDLFCGGAGGMAALPSLHDHRQRKEQHTLRARRSGHTVGGGGVGGMLLSRCYA